jgi:hypothetical protein
MLPKKLPRRGRESRPAAAAKRKLKLADVQHIPTYSTIPSPARRTLNTTPAGTFHRGHKNDCSSIDRASSQTSGDTPLSQKHKIAPPIDRASSQTSVDPQPFGDGSIYSIRSQYYGSDLDDISGRSSIQKSSQQKYRREEGWRIRDSAGAWGDLGSAAETLGGYSTSTLDGYSISSVASPAPSLAFTGPLSIIGIGEGGMPVPLSPHQQSRRAMSHWTHYLDPRPALRASIRPETSTYHTLPRKR